MGAVAVLETPSHGKGKLRRGNPGNAGGSGRPADKVRAKLRDLGLKKSVPFLTKLLDGEVQVSLLGKCDACGHDQPISEELLEHWNERVKASVTDRLKAAEQTLKYGLQAKELVIANGNAANFFDCVHQAIVEEYGSDAAERIKFRASQLLEAVK